MRLRTKLIAALIIAPLLIGADCGISESDPRQPGHDPNPAPKSAGPVVKDPNPGVQPEPPKADPMACEPQCDPKKFVTMRVAWLGEVRGDITVYINGVKVKKVRGGLPNKVYGIYTGAWQEDFSLSGVTRIGFDWAPDQAFMEAQCSIAHDGQIVDHMGVSTGPCVVNWDVQ